MKFNDDELRNTKSNLDGNPKIGWLCNKKGLLLKTYRWLAKNATGVILLIHGLKAHIRLTFMRINLKMPNGNEGLIVDTNNYYIYKDSWIEKFNQSGYSVYALDLQGHGESQGWKNVRGDFSSFYDLIDDVLQYMNQIQDEISNDNQTDGESYDIVSTKKKKLPMYVIGYSTGGNIALRILQLLNKEKEDRIKAWNSNNYKNSNIILDNSTDVNDIDNGMSNYKNGDPGTSSASTSATTNAIISANDKHKGCYNSLDKFNIKGCITISGMIRIKSKRDPGNKSLKYFYLPIIKLLSLILPYKRFLPLSSYKGSAYIANVSKHDKFRNNNGITFKSMYELIKATITLDYNINYMPKDVPLLFVHSKDDRVCSYEWTALFHNKVKVDKKDLYTLDDMGHAITMKPGNEEVLKKIIDWIYDLRNGEDEIEDEI
ncbi:lysophospholipase, putative [Plasmodium chabaudi chabaudi]|uniref:Lysophospholipase, putative n=1 Tax=Plasmodium chabaudi chabaudi TaxID=31271 RepID=A0A4V0KCL0_PLACU|nr:lysophospholipase, putative [Plasmodium chabaudi chabaudi]VTZ70697.1 lysophospholipase, putative [Plasmodium chabaudi chabaudi]|eukprot:XP_016654799.1 lysophospholipase, putative [Plasmodium chabaudi chabaudi]